MDTNRAATPASVYRARLRGGPDDGTDIGVAPLADGAPPEFLHSGPDDSGMYLLAGLPDPDGSLPYWWVPSQASAFSPGDPGEATWTLISLADDGATKMWHQHGEDAEPVPLNVEPVGSGDLPSHIGRAYSCPACHDTAVLSRPMQIKPEETLPLDPTARRVN